MFKKRISLLLVFSFTAFPVFAVMKQHYGGNVRVAEELLSSLSAVSLFETAQDSLKSAYPFPFRIDQNRLVAELDSLPADRITELDRSVSNLRNESNRCHWILDYPYFGHLHASSVSIEKEQLIIEAEEPEFLPLMAQSNCLLPEPVSYLPAFRKTQFGFEANTTALAGRPFLDSISPAVVDPMNPYLSFKLGEVDVFSIPEEKFREVSSDEQIKILSGPQYYVYLKTENLTPEQVSSVSYALDLHEISRAALNEHAQIYLEKKRMPGQTWKGPVYLKIPEELPFRLLGDRIRVQLENAGFTLSAKAPSKSEPVLEISVSSVREADPDLFRYRLLREEFQIPSQLSWFEVWDELEASGRIVPLLLYESRIAVRKNLIDVRSGSGGIPDFSNAWILPDTVPRSSSTVR